MEQWKTIRGARAHNGETRQGYATAQMRYEIGLRVRQLRDAKGLSQGELAVKTHTSQAAIARLEAGGVEPRLSTLERIGAALDAQLLVQLVTRER